MKPPLPTERPYFSRLSLVVISVLFLRVIPAIGQQTAEPPALPEDRLPRTLAIDSIPAGLDSIRRIPADNQLTEARVMLGRKLFFDPLLSADQTVSCASCHVPELGFASSSKRAVGINGQIGQRHSPSLLNRAFGSSFFWDGRAASLEEQALKPIDNPKELGAGVATAIERLQASSDYPTLFQSAYGELSEKNLARALASFQRVLLSGDSRVDRFQAADRQALSNQERQGLWLFESRAGCWKCHSGRNYSDEAFHNTGVSWGKKPKDLGRFEVTKQESDQGKFKTPTLRDVARTAPYMHDGNLATLTEVVQFYNRGGGRNPNLDSAIQPLNLSADDVQNLVAFLEALDGSQMWVVAGDGGVSSDEPAGPPQNR